MSTTSNEQVKDAAEALVAVLKAVGGKVESVNSEQQQSFNDVVKTLQKSVDTLNETMQTFNASLEAMKETNEKVVTQSKEQTKQLRLQHLIRMWQKGTLISPPAFGFQRTAQLCVLHSSDLVEGILQPFLLGLGYDIPQDCYCADKFIESNHKITDDESTLFRTKLVDYVEKLIGHKPCLVRNENGTHTLYYS